MGQPIPCDVCGQTTADFVVTVVHDGQVVGVGVECLLDWALPIADAYAQAVAREQGDPGTVNPQAHEPPEMEVIPVSDGPDSAREPAEDDQAADTPKEPARAAGGRRGRQTGR